MTDRGLDLGPHAGPGQVESAGSRRAGYQPIKLAVMARLLRRCRRE